MKCVEDFRTLLLVMLLAMLVILLSACSTVTIRSEGGVKETTPPTYLDSKPFYLFGLIGSHEVDVNEVCEGAEVLQMQTARTMNDYLFGLATWFIYSPRTAKVWCGE
jgi:hypothetical protein